MLEGAAAPAQPSALGPIAFICTQLKKVAAQPCAWRPQVLLGLRGRVHRSGFARCMRQDSAGWDKEAAPDKQGGKPVVRLW